MFKIIKKGNNNFWHNYAVKNMEFSHWEIIFNHTLNTIVLQMLNGENFPKQSINIDSVIVIDETDASIEETFANTELLRIRLVELGYNPLLLGDSQLTADEINAIHNANNPSASNPFATMDDVSGGGDFIPRLGTEVGFPITGNLELDTFNTGALNITTSDFSAEILNKAGVRFVDGGVVGFQAQTSDTNYTSNAELDIDSFKVFSDNPNFKGIISEQDFSEIEPTNLNIYAQRQYVENKLANKADKPSFMLLPSDYTLINQTALQKAFNLGSLTTGSIPIISGKKYKFYAILFFDGLPTNSIGFGMLGDVANCADIKYKSSSAKGTSFSFNNFSTFSLSTLTASNAFATGLAEIEGTFRTTGSGVVIPSVGFSASNATMKLLKGSYFELIPLCDSSVSNSSDIV